MTSHAMQETLSRSRIGEVAEELNLPVATIRVWERRYGLPESKRTAGGHRRFGPSEVAQLTWMLDEVSRGRPPREAAALIHRRQRDRHRPSYCLVRSLLQGGDDDRRVRQVLDAAAHRLGPVQAMATVVAWTLRELRCPTGPTPPGLGESLRGWLRNVRGQGDHGTVLVAWMREGRPDLALEAIGALSRAMGWSTEELGPQTPLVAPDHSLPVTDRSSAVVLDAGASSDRGRALQTLRAAARIHPGPLFYMGTTFAAPGSRRHAPGRYLDDDFAIAAETYLRSMPTWNEDER